MANIGDPISPAIPPVGSSGPQYATDIDAILTEVVARLSNKVPLSSVSFNGNVDFGGSQILNVGYVTLANSAVSPVASPVNRVTAFNGDLWYVSPSNPIQLTTGGILNAAAVGGITGDYGGANPAQFRMDAINARYNAYANFGTNTWADVRMLGLDLAKDATSSVFLRLLWGGAVNRTYTLPPAPASTADRPVYMDTTGQLTLGFISKQYHFSALSSTFSGATASSDTANGGIFATGGGGAYNFNTAIAGIITAEKINTALITFKTAGIQAFTATVKKVNTAGVVSVVGTSSGNSAAGMNTVTITPGAPETVVDGTHYYTTLAINMAAGDGYIGTIITTSQDA